MRFLCLYKPGKSERPPTQQEMADMGKLIEESMKAGWLLATEGCLPTAAGARVRLSDGKFLVTDGPFAETKEVVGGFAIIQASSKQEAIEHTKYFLQVAGGGETEIRQLYEAPAAASGKS
ncbi:MAG TPA: YciI family protein [Bryobacteraceae bacterium]|nr:YciI family protein [Bryobacteraceae bacterium]